MGEGERLSWAASEIRWLWKQARPLLYWHVASFLCIAAGSILALSTPLVLRWLVDAVLPQRRAGLLFAAVLVVFLSYQLKIALTSLGNYLTLSAAQRMNLGLRMTLLRHLDSLSADYYDRVPVGAVVYAFKEPVEEISHFGSELVPALLRMSLTALFAVAAMFMISPALAITILPLVPVFLITRRYYRRKLTADSDRVQLNRLSWNAFLDEHLSSVIPIQLLRQENRQERKAFRLLAGTIDSELRLFRTGVRFIAGTSLAVVAAMAAVLGYGGWSVLHATLTMGSLVAFYSLVTQLFDPLSGAAELYSRAQNAFASIRQVRALLAQSPALKDSPRAIRFPQHARADISLLAVEFGYPRQAETLSVPCLQIGFGEHVAITGENGAGKSTLAKLIARIYDVQSGSISIGSHDIRSIRLDSLRHQVCYLPRDPVLFDGTLEFNLRFARPGVTELELEEALRCADLSSFVATLPEGVGQRIGPGGCQLSGGQRQRLAIARALLWRPQILILDEATSCLDPSSESLILANLKRRLGPLTLLVITHRLATLSSCNRTLVLSGGRIVGDETGFTCQENTGCKFVGSPPAVVHDHSRH